MTYTKEEVIRKITLLINDYKEFKKQKLGRKEKLEDLTEANVIADYIDRLFEILGWNVRNPDEYYRESYIRGAGFADIALKLPDKSGTTVKFKPKIFIEAKRFGGIPKREERAFQKTLLGIEVYADWTDEERQVLNYASKTLDVKWAILTNFEKFRLFNARTGDEILDIEKPEGYLEEIDSLLRLTKDSVETGRIDILGTKIVRPDVDTKFLALMNTWRLQIAKSIYDNNRDQRFEINGEEIKLSFESNEESDRSLEIIKEATQRILDRLIIIKYAEDKFVIDPEQLEEKNKSWKITKDYSSLFYELKGFFKGFWGKHDSKIFEPDHICEKVRIDDEVLSNVIEGICGMNFRKFTSDILGNTYESYLGHELYFNERDVLDIRPNQQLKKSGGIYYTPPYVVEYIVENSLGIKLNEIWNDVDRLLYIGEYERAYNKFIEVSEIKVLDPACGSGSFLVKAFYLIKKNYERYNEKIDEEQQIKHKKFMENKGVQLNLEEEHFLTRILNYERQILMDNIYGVDLDFAACEIASVNLMLQALKRGETLPMILGDNLKVGDSLISGSIEKLGEYFDDTEKLLPFNWKDEFANICKDNGFDVVIGNPPWVTFSRVTGTERIKGDFEKRIVDFLRMKYPNSAEYKLSTYAVFMNRGITLLKNNGLFGFIVPDSFLLGRYFSKLRRYILDTTKIREIILILEDFWVYGTIGRSVIILLEKENNESIRKNNKVLVKLCLTLNDLGSRNFKTNSYGQGYFEKLIYNRFRLFFDETSMNFVNKMEQNTIKLKNIVSIHTGIRSKIGQDKIISKIQKDERWKPGLISAREIKRYSLNYGKYFINIDPSILWSGGYDSDIIFRNKLFMRKTGDSLIATFDNSNYYYLDNLHSIILEDNRYNLKYVLAVVNSKIMNNYYHLISLEFGRVMAQTDIETIEQLPMREIDFSNQDDRKKHDALVELVNKMLILNKQKDTLLDLFKDLVIKFRQNKESRPLSNYYTTKRLISLDDYASKGEQKDYLVTKYGINIIKSLEKINFKEKGRVVEIKCEEDNNNLILMVKLEKERELKEMLKIYFEDELMMRFFHFSIEIDLFDKGKKKYWSKEEIWEVLDEIKIPRNVPNIDSDVKNIRQLMKTFEEAYKEKLSSEFTESPLDEMNLTTIENEIKDIDASIDKFVYDLYGLTDNEIRDIEKASEKIFRED